MKKCIICKGIKGGRFNSKGWCRSCYEKDLKLNNPEYADRQRKNSREWHERNKESRKPMNWAWHLKRTYGITPEIYFTMLTEQNNGCKLCGRPPHGKNKMPVDHCHKTGKVRGILCTPCNRALGILENNIENVLKYLEIKE